MFKAEGQRGSLIVMSGPSGVGKGTVCRAAMAQNSNLKLSVSATTRAPRSGEKDGVNYFFLDQTTFEERISEDAFLEYARVHDHYYGTPKAYVEQLLNQGTDVILEIDVQGALQIKESLGYGVYIFIAPPSLEELKQRLIGRQSESPEQVVLRLANALKELSLADQYDYIVTNDDLEKATRQFLHIIDAQHCLVKTQWPRIKQMIEGVDDEQ
ncbi:guanylate kinase [Pseudoramibacter alactolyticus]|uniref:guanylate kinase n=1 Tax=Pseudoramibacter alactolyticus TaxID=113287 RepID=UPI00248D6055|nr:guanylate kinase [Pseudoramibacter alactolyticus]